MSRYGISLVSEPHDHTTGVVTYATELIRHLVPLLGPDERLVVFRHPRFPLPQPGNPRLEDWPIPFPASRRSAARRLAEQTLLPAAALAARVTLVHCVQNFGPIASPRPLVLTVHDARLFESRDAASTGQRLWREVVNPTSIRRAARLIGDSAWGAAQCAAAFKIPVERFHVIPLGVDHSAFAAVPPEDEARVDRELGLTGPVLLFTGLFGPNKNLPRLLEAFARVLRETTSRERAPVLVLAGGGGSDAALVRERVGALELTAHVRLPGYLPRPDLLALFRRARAVVFPSLEEGFGLPLLEAFAAGTAALTSNRGALQELAGDAALLVDPEDTADIARGITRLLDDDGLQRDLARRGLARARDFTWENCARRTLAVYRSIG